MKTFSHLKKLKTRENLANGNAESKAKQAAGSKRIQSVLPEDTLCVKTVIEVRRSNKQLFLCTWKSGKEE